MIGKTVKISSEYGQLLNSEPWKGKRITILKRDGNKCRMCGETSRLNVHHKEYHIDNETKKFVPPWDYKNRLLVTLCETCHKKEHSINTTPIYVIYNKPKFKTMINQIKNLLTGKQKSGITNHNDNSIINHNTIGSSKVIKVDFQDFGLKRAGATGGDPVALENNLHDIRNGYIVDINENEEEHQRIRETRQLEIDNLRKEKNERESELRKINEVEIPYAKEKISDFKKERSDLDLEKEKGSNNNTINRFNLNLYWPVFIAATAFLYGFYLSAFHSAFFKDIAKALSEASVDNISELLNTVFNIEAFKVFNLHWFAPIIFFVFSLGLHIVLDGDKKYKYLLLTGVLILILIADCLLAYFIEYNSHIIQVLNGLADPDWVFYKSPRFYLVLFLGFFTCLGWSLILHAIRNEYEKEDLKKIVKIQKQKLTEKEKELQEKISELLKKAIDIEAEVSPLKDQIDSKLNSLNVIDYSLGDLNKRITTFFDGWLTFVTSLRNEPEKLLESERVMKEFKGTYLNGPLKDLSNQVN